MAHLTGQDQVQRGGPVKPVEILLVLARWEGVAEAKDMSFRLPLGGECFDNVK